MQIPDKNAIFALLERHGITRAVFAFDGGHDEGQITSRDFFAGDEDEPLPYLEATKALDKAYGKELLPDMEEFLYSYYAYFNGYPYVSDELVWDVPAKKLMVFAEEEVVTMQKYEAELL